MAATATSREAGTESNSLATERRFGERTDGQTARERARARVIGDRDSRVRRSLAVADMITVAFALCMSALILGDDTLTLSAIAVPLVFVVVNKALGLYDRDAHVIHRTTLDEVPALFGVATLTALLLYLAGDALVEGDLGRRQIVGTWLLLFFGAVTLRALARSVANHLASPERCLLVGDPAVGEVLRAQFEMSAAVNAELVAIVPHSSIDSSGDEGVGPAIGPTLMDNSIDRVILSVGHAENDAILYMIRELKQSGVKVSVLPPASRIAGPSVEPDHLHGVTLLGMRRFEFTRSSRLVKRTFDIAGSALALAVLAIPLALIALAVRLTSPGPALFRQDRVGRNGRPFRILKFRTMNADADDLKIDFDHLNRGAKGFFKIPEDPRVTKVGRVLRRWQLDELPQLVNVLRGEMSLVGPRPLISEEDGMIEGWYRRRLDVPPGITGHWQILGSSSTIPLKEMVKLDYLYVATWSLWGDIRLLMRTIPFMVRRGGV